VGVGDRQHERAGPIGQRLVDIGARLEQDPRRVDVTAANGKQVGREPRPFDRSFKWAPMRSNRATLRDCPPPPISGLLFSLLSQDVGAVGRRTFTVGRRRNARLSSARFTAGERALASPPACGSRSMIAAFAFVAAR
jgi:hypothetical protein